MFKKLILMAVKWHALRRLPQDYSEKPFVFFELKASWMVEPERVMVYESKSKIVLLYEPGESPDGGIPETIIRELSLQERADLFDWLRGRFQNPTTLIKLTFIHDPTRLRLFARDSTNNWHCSISIADIHYHDQQMEFRPEFIQKITSLL
jgi:hypothetical protein